jgi:ABC-type thiamine transport system ATPase subunit
MGVRPSSIFVVRISSISLCSGTLENLQHQHQQAPPPPLPPPLFFFLKSNNLLAHSTIQKNIALWSVGKEQI